MISLPSVSRAGLAPASSPVDVVQALRDLYATNPLARAFFNAAGERTKRSWRETSVATAIRVITEKLGRRPSRQAVVDVFTTLHELGVARRILGRTGHPTRVEWQIRSVSAADAAVGRADTLELWRSASRSKKRRLRRNASVPASAATPTVAGGETSTATPAKSVVVPSAKQQTIQIDVGNGVRVSVDCAIQPSPTEQKRLSRIFLAAVQSAAKGAV